MASLVEDLRAQAATDPLTGLGHHRSFQDRLAGAHIESLAVLVIDVDGFKEVNDRLGHQAGDRLLRRTAAVLADELRSGDELFRIGGDEFAALVRVEDQGDALDLGRRLCAAVRGQAGVTVSVGVGVPGRSEALGDLVARADRALYEAKRAGRDGAVLAGG